MKKIFLILLFLLSLTNFAQNLESKIPANAKAVVSVDGNIIFDLISMADMNNNTFIKKLLKKSKTTSLADFGFDLKSKAYYFYTAADSTQSHIILVKLNNKANFEKLLNNREKESIKTVAGYQVITNSNSATAWNDKLLILTIDPVGNTYSRNYHNHKAYKISEDNEIFEESEMEEPDYKSVEKVVEETVLESTENDYDANEKELTTKAPNFDILNNTILSIINNKSSQSILKNTSYQKNKKKRAAVHLWVENYSDLATSILVSSSGLNYKMDAMLAGIKDKKDLFGMGEVNSYLYFNEDEVHITSNVQVLDNYLDTFKTMYSSKLDKKFFKYFNQNNALAYASFSTDTEAILNSYPKFMSEMYGAILPNFKEETAVVIDLISVIIDEKAIGELITGDVMFVLNDIAEKEVEYKSYSYDDDYNRTEVVKTKMELLPDFTLMIGSKNAKLINKLMNLGVKHKIAELNASVFKIDALKTKMPFDLYLTNKDGIAFLTTSKITSKEIARGYFKSNLGDHKKMLKKNIMVGYVNLQKIFDKIPDSYINGKEREFMNSIKNDITSFYTTASKIKKDRFYSDQVIKTSSKEGNSLRLIFKTIDKFMLNF